MRWITIMLTLIVIVSSFRSAETGLEVVITGARNNKGHVLLTVFNKADGFPEQSSKAFRRLRLTITQKTASVIITGLPPGDYAVAILHDENDDAKMNTNWIGIPKEGFGFSNNVMGLLGPPSFSKAKITYNGTAQRTTIHLKYF